MSRVLEITHRHTFTFTQTLHTVPGVSLPPVLFLPELNNSFLVPGTVISFDLSSTPTTLDRCSMSIFDLGAQKLIDGSELDMKSIAGKPALAMNVASR